jgi:hypothetical protein
MSDTDPKLRILSFASHLGPRDPETAARGRNWIDETGRPTEEGLGLVRALAEQQATRSVFRGNF